MDVLHTLKNTYVKERRAVTVRGNRTFRGFFLRLFNAEKHWDELTAQENRLLDLGTRTLSDILNVQGKSARELKTYQLILKNLNVKLTERGNFLLVLVTFITALGLTKVNDVLNICSMSRDGLILFAIGILTIFLALNDTLRVRNRAAIHEELINVIERHLLSKTSDAPAPAPAPAHTAHAAPSSKVAKNILRTIFHRTSCSALFKASAVLFGIGLVGISQTGLALYEKELDAHADKFRIEAITHRPLNETDCRFMGTHEVECFMAQHKMDASDSALGLLKAVVNAAFTFRFLCFIASIAIFLSTPFASNLFVAKKPTSHL